MNSRGPGFEIFQNEALHERVLDMVYQHHLVVLNATRTSSITNRDTKRVGVRLISDSINLYHHLSQLAPGSFEIVNQQNSEDALRLEITKVGKVTGDLCVTITGYSSDVLEVSIDHFIALSIANKLIDIEKLCNH